MGMFTLFWKHRKVIIPFLRHWNWTIMNIVFIIKMQTNAKGEA